MTSLFASLAAERAITLQENTHINHRDSARDERCALERARIFLRLRRSLRDLFFFHFSRILQDEGQNVEIDRGNDEDLLCSLWSGLVSLGAEGQWIWMAEGAIQFC